MLGRTGCSTSPRPHQRNQSKALLSYPQINEPFTLHTDASDRAVEAVLLLDNKIIGFCSSKLDGCECNCTTIEKETFAVIKPLSYFKNIIFSSKIHLMTDNKNILALTPDSSRIIRCELLIEEMDVELHQIGGKQPVR